jgi:hypothetical protein
VFIVTVPLDDAGLKPGLGLAVLPAVRATRGGLNFESHLGLEPLFLDPIDKSLLAVLTCHKLITKCHILSLRLGVWIRTTRLDVVGLVGCM